jgi:hypothetical protein
MRLRDILQRPELRLTPLTPADVDRAVTRVFVTDLLDPGRYLSGGEVVLTGLIWHHGPDTSETFVTALARAGVAALGAGDAALGGVPGDLVAACERHGVPLFEVPVEISFTAILDAAAPAVWSARAADLTDILGRHRTMVSALAGGARLAELLPQTARQLGLECWVLTAAGGRLAGTGPLPAEAAEAALAAFHTAPALPAPVVSGAGRLMVHRAGGSFASRLNAWCVVTRGGDAAAVEEMASLVELDRTGYDERRRIERRLTGELLASAAAGADLATLRARLVACGLPPDAPTLVAAAQAGGLPAATTLAVLDELAQACADDDSPDVGRPCASADLNGVAMTVLPAGADAAGRIELLRRAASTLAAGLGTDRIAVGVSSVAEKAADLADALAQAVNMLHLAAAGRQGVDIIVNDQVTTYDLLLAGVPPQTRQAFHDHLLGPLLAYDQDRHADLMPTLRAFLDASGSWQECAKRMHLHVNTLRYRLRRIEELTGRDLRRFEDRVDLFLALRMNHRTPTP